MAVRNLTRLLQDSQIRELQFNQDVVCIVPDRRESPQPAPLVRKFLILRVLLVRPSICLGQ
jgi:hypothetical protein